MLLRTSILILPSLNNTDLEQNLCAQITYIVFSIPGTLLAKMVDPSKSIACGALIWSIAATCQAATKVPAGLFICRLFTGIGESCFAQAIALYFTYWCVAALKSLNRLKVFVDASLLPGPSGTRRTSSPSVWERLSVRAP